MNNDSVINKHIVVINQSINEKRKTMKFSVNITLTWSKIMALLVLVAGVVVGLKTNDANVFMTTIGAVTLILGVKQVAESKRGN